MISRLIFIALAACVTLTSCDTDILTINRDFESATIRMEVPATDMAGPVTISHEGIVTDLRQKLVDFDISEDQLRGVGVKKVVATINDPAGNFTFDDLTNVTLVLTNESLGNVTIANLPDGTGTTAELEIANAELKEYLLSDTFDAVLSGTSSEGIGADVTVAIDVTYTLTGGL